MHNVQCSSVDDLRLFDLITRFKQGDEESFSYIIKRFKPLIEKESYNIYLGVTDEDLRAQIYLSLLIRLRQYKIPDIATLKTENKPENQ